MKKLLLSAAFAFTAVLMTGCLGPKADNYGFPTVPAGILFSDMQTGQIVQHKTLPQERKFKVLKRVSAEATTTAFIGLVSIGDASYYTLKAKALQECREADDIIDLEIDSHHDNMLGIINKVKVTVRGVAIKYDRAD